MGNNELNDSVYKTRGVVKHYATLSELHPCETYAFEKYIREGDCILDIGVGAGRTTPHLTEKASRYLGVDFSPEMVSEAKNRYSDIDFRCGDARDLKELEDETFDIVVFSFDGISAIPAKEGVMAALNEAHRVLKPGGLFLFSASNARFLIFTPLLEGANVMQKAWRLAISIIKTFGLLSRQARYRAFSRGEGYMYVPVHNGMRLYTTTPGLMSKKLSAIGFRSLEIVNYDHPKTRNDIFVGSYFYIARKTA